MKSQTRHSAERTDSQTEIPSTRLFAAFSRKRRQYALEYLSQKPGAISLGDLAEYIALEEGEPSYDWYERILTDLHHNHLPSLVAAGLVSYDREAERVQLAVDRTVVSPYLRLAAGDTLE